MWENRENYTALAILPEDLGTYVQAPFEEITKEKFEIMVKQLHDIDLSKVKEFGDSNHQQEELACAGGACEVKFA